MIIRGIALNRVLSKYSLDLHDGGDIDDKHQT